MSMLDWTRVQKTSGCWLWTGAKTGSGYGQISRQGPGWRKTHLAHRLAYEELVGPIPGDKEIDHLCCNPVCVNPNHLEPVTHAENLRRMTERGRNWQQAKTHCPKGHPYSGDNLILPRRGGRGCRTCKNAFMREYDKKRGWQRV